MWYKSYYDLTATKQYSARILQNELEYTFSIMEGRCTISIYLFYYGTGVLYESRGNTTEEACKKTISKFYKTYKKK